MFKIGDKEYKDEEIGLAYWEQVKTRMESCRRIAKETLQTMNREAFYRIDYDVDPGIRTVYADSLQKNIKPLRGLLRIFMLRLVSMRMKMNEWMSLVSGSERKLFNGKWTGDITSPLKIGLGQVVIRLF